MDIWSMHSIILVSVIYFAGNFRSYSSFCNRSSSRLFSLSAQGQVVSSQIFLFPEYENVRGQVF
jgi:hypothetical protein